MRRPKVLRAETRDYGELRCPNCGASTILRVGVQNLIVWDSRNKTFTVIQKEIGKDGMISNRQFKTSFLCQKCGHEWSIISGV